MARLLVVLDVDSTLVENEVIELLAEDAGSLAEVADITSRAMNGELDFAESLRSRVSTLAGLPESVFASVRTRVTVTNGVDELIAGVHAAGGVIGVVSGGFAEIVDPLARELKLDYWRANRLEVEAGLLTGGLTGTIIDAEAKATIDGDYCPRDVGGIVARKPRDDLRDLERARETASRDLLEVSLLLLWWQFGRHVGLDEARCDDVRRDAPAAEFARE